MNDKYQDFLNKLQSADESERDWLVMEFSLQNLSETLQQAVWAAAIPHWFDHDFLNAVLANPLKDSDFQALTELSFIETYPERGFNVHERSRNLLLNRLWATNKTRYQKLSKRAAAYCKKQDQNNTAWRVESLYHGLLANSQTTKQAFINQGLGWWNGSQFEKLEHLTSVVLEAVYSGKLTGDSAGYAHSFQAKVDNIYSRYESAKKHLYSALAQNTQNKHLKVICLMELGRAHYHLNEYNLAPDYYQQALKICQQVKDRVNEANCNYFLGDVHAQLNEYELARKRYQQALAIFQQFKQPLGEGNCLQSLGDVHLQLAEYKQARDNFQQALELYQKIKRPLSEANCISALGEMHNYLAEYGQAQDCYSQALVIYQKINHRLGEANCLRFLGSLNGSQGQTELAFTRLQQAAELYKQMGDQRSKAACFDDLARLYQRQKQFAPALAAFKQAIEIFPNAANFYINRAELYLQMEDYEKAGADIKQVEILDRNSAYTLSLTAALALWQQQPSQAVELCQQALAQRPADGNFRALFALALLANGQAQAAYSEMEQALTAIYEQHDFDDLLDDLDKLAKIYGHSADVDNLRKQILNRCQK
ncbi:MAG: tetratricopeptide repeat protein [Methylococcaceae bacterium]